MPDATGQQRVVRKLAAIVAADIAGYSRLMGADEVGTLQALKAHRKALIDPTIAAHHGRIVKTTGDGMLVEFASVVDAVTCSVAIQRGMINRNADGGIVLSSRTEDDGRTRNEVNGDTHTGSAVWHRDDKRCASPVDRRVALY
jgi:class 3 adenylate cyclase